MFLTERKLDRRIDELKDLRYRETIKLETLLAAEDLEMKVNPEPPTDHQGWDTIRTGDLWKGRDKYLWLYKEVEVPKHWKGKRVLGIFDFGKTGAGNNSGFESLLYLNGKPYQGVDSNHKEVFLSEDLCGSNVKLEFRLWSGLEGGGVPADQEHRISQAELAWLDDSADDLFYLGSVVLGTVKCLNDEDPVKQELLKALDEAFLLIDWSDPKSDEFYQSIKAADGVLNDRIKAMDKRSLVKLHCVGHTHIDVAWLWTLKNTREKCSRSFSTVLRLMELFPEYIFLQTQPQLYDYVKKDFPELYENIKARIGEGRWEADGGMWVEADCNLTSGESLTRQLLIGSRFLKEEFGRDVKYLWLPDVFGYSWALPQILKKSGINTFMTTKISWNQYNRMPHDTFKWKGMDGSEVLTHFITAPTPWQEPGSWFYTYNGELIPQTVKGTWDAYSDKAVNKDLLIAYGHGDGGGGVNRDMLERRRRLDMIPGLPEVVPSTAGDYFDKLQETVEHTDQYVHTWDGELYLEYHRGTYTSHAANKRMNRKMELLYRETEWISAMAAAEGGDIALAGQEYLTEGWKILLTNQFHDIIPGSSIKEVYDTSKVDYEIAEEIAKNRGEQALAQFMKAEDNCFTLFNPTSWNQDSLVLLPCETELAAVDGKGNSLPVQKAEGGLLVKVTEVPAMGYGIVKMAGLPEQKAENPFAVSGSMDNKALDMVVETPFYVMSINHNGQITRLLDKEYKKEVLPKGERANVLQMFEDKPLDNDAWDIDIFYQQKKKEITELTGFQVLENGPLRLKLHFEWVYGKSSFSQDMVLYEGSRRIDFETKVDYHEKHQLLKAAFPVDIRSNYATYDIQYGNVRRPNHWNTSWDQARFEMVAHKWADLSQRDYGVSLLNDCKYGYDIKDNVLRISLLRAATHPDYEQDQGLHVFTYALLPHSGDFVQGQTEKEAFLLNQPLNVVRGCAGLPYESFISFIEGDAVIDAVKAAEDGNAMVIRFHEYKGGTMSTALKLGFAYQSWQECDLMERPVEDLRTDDIVMDVKPYEIKTILVQI